VSELLVAAVKSLAKSTRTLLAAALCCDAWAVRSAVELEYLLSGGWHACSCCLEASVNWRKELRCISLGRGAVAACVAAGFEMKSQGW
jgi:hypothetical protein